MKRPLFLLVHGYMGSPEDMAPLAEAIRAVHGEDSVRLLALHSQWRGGSPPAFDAEAFIQTLLENVSNKIESDRPWVLVGHSTGGCIALLALARLEAKLPALLVLAASPARANLERFTALGQSMRPDTEAPSVTDGAHLMRTINLAGKTRLTTSIPVLALNGDLDALVPVQDLRLWADGHLGVPVRTAVVPGADHDLFKGKALALVKEHILETVEDVLGTSPEASEVERLRDLEPALIEFAERFPGGLRRLRESPGVERALKPSVWIPPDLGPVAGAPVIANIETTTRCPLKCPACARTLAGTAVRDMNFHEFESILGRLPHASRVTLVGLGEPTLHPQLPVFVELAARQGRSVSLVTSGSVLSPGLAERLCSAGLSGITFSLDAAEEALAARLRPGVSFEKIRQKLLTASEIFQSKDVPMAVFTALSVDNARHLDSIADFSLALGARAWMLSDLNFAENLDRSLYAAADEEDKAAIRRSLDRALGMGLPALQVRGLEEIGKPRRLRELLLRPADSLWSRSPGHRTCLSPWQTVPVSVDGTVTACDCQPGRILGNLFEQSLSEIWNGQEMRRLREDLLANRPGPACKTCPRL